MGTLNGVLNPSIYYFGNENIRHQFFVLMKISPASSRNRPSLSLQQPTSTLLISRRAQSPIRLNCDSWMPAQTLDSPDPFDYRPTQLPHPTTLSLHSAWT